MSTSAFDRASTLPNNLTLPLRSTLKSSKTVTLIYGVLILPVLVVAATALTMTIAIIASNTPAKIDTAIFSARILPILVGYAILIVFIAYPTRQLLVRLGAQSTLNIDSERIVVSENYLFGSRTWSIPLIHYRGIATRTRTTFSRTTQEILLIPAARTQPLLLSLVPPGDAATAKRIANLLNLPVIDLAWPQPVHRITPTMPPSISMETLSPEPSTMGLAAKSPLSV